MKVKNKTIILVFVNYQYLNVLNNWIYFVQRLNIDNFVIVSLDVKIYKYLKTKNINTILSICDLDLGKLWIHRVKIIQKYINDGYDVIHSDADAVWTKNPLLMFKKIDSDLIFSQGTYWPKNIHEEWGFVLCCGLFLIRSNEKTKKFLDKWLGGVREYQDDQVSLNNLLSEQNIKWEKDDFYKILFRGIEFQCYTYIVNGLTENGLKVSMLPHKQFQRIKEDSDDVYVKHIISEKNSDSVIGVLKDNGCYVSFE